MFDDTDASLSDLSGNGQKGGYFGTYQQSQQAIIPDGTNSPCVLWPGVAGDHAFVPKSALLNLQTLTFVISVKYAGKIGGGSSFAVIASQDMRRPGSTAGSFSATTTLAVAALTPGFNTLTRLVP